MKLIINTIAFVFLGSLLYMSCKTIDASYSKTVKLNDVAYNNTIKNIVRNNCTTCHSGRKPAGGLNLKSYENVVDAVKNNALLKRINNTVYPMPPDEMLSKKERLIIQKWVENNFALASKTAPQSIITESNDLVFEAPLLSAVNIEQTGFEFLEKIQGHWVGEIFLLGQNIPWFAFDFRAINTSQVHAIFEGGSMGNLFNTFFVAEYKGVKTIMLRNGGILGGIYRTSYFVLTKVENNQYFFEDAYGGKQIMWVKVSFQQNKMKMIVYTSKLGLRNPSKHLEFTGEKLHSDLAQKSAQKFNFPTKKVVKKFSNGMPLPNWGEEYPIVTSASYITEDDNADYEVLGKRAQDPIQMRDLKNIAKVKLNFSRTDLSKGKKINVYLSKESLSKANGDFKTEYGYITKQVMNKVILFPEIDKDDNTFTLTYLHTGKCYITFVIDNNQDQTPNIGDFYSESIELNLNADEIVELEVGNILKTIVF